MQFNSTLRWTRFIGHRDGRRIPGRLPQEMLVSNLGPVLDLSTGGMRILATRHPSQAELDISLHGGDVRLRLDAKVAWVRRLGFRRLEIGLTFLNVDDHMANLLAKISTEHRTRQAV